MSQRMYERRLPHFDIAQIVVQALHDGEGRFRRCSLHAFAVMPNHVHLLVTPWVRAREWLEPLKGFTGYQAIRILGRKHSPFWQDESYDHMIRSDEEFTRVQRYIECTRLKRGWRHHQRRLSGRARTSRGAKAPRQP